MKKLIQYVVILFFLGCTPQNPLNPFFQVASTREINVKDLDLTKLSKKENMVGESCTFCVPFIHGCEPSIADAIEDALQKGNGDLLLDANLIINLDFYSCVKVIGTVVNTKEAK